jgi:hypothetical protein
MDLARKLQQLSEEKGMSARDEHYFVKDGKIILRSENDGWTFVNRGPKAVDREVTLEEVKNHPCFTGDYERIVAQLKKWREGTLPHS